MKRERYTEGQIVSILKEHEAGASVPDLARRHGEAYGSNGPRWCFGRQPVQSIRLS